MEGQNTALSCTRTEYCSELVITKPVEIHQYCTVPRHTEDDHPILHKEVEAAVQSLKKGKSARIDNIPAELV